MILIRLIRNEHMKIYRRTGTWVMIGLIILAILGVGLFSEYASKSNDNVGWKKQLLASNMQLEKQMKEQSTIGSANNYFKQKIDINTYRIQYDIPPVSSKSLWGYMINTTNFTGLAALFTIVIAARVVASEFSWGTIKLLLIRPVNRSKILLSKYISTITFAFFMLFLLFFVSFIMGILFFGFSGSEYPYLSYQQGHVVEQNMVSHILVQYGLNSIDLFMMATVAFMISTIFRSSSLAIGISIFLMFTGPQIAQLLSRYDWDKYVLFANTNLEQYINGTPLVKGMTMSFSISVLVVYYAIFIVLSWIIFKKRDVTA